MSKKAVYSNPDRKPQVLAPVFEGVPKELRETDRWVLWRLEWRGREWAKVPCQTNGQHAKSTDPTTWNSFEAVKAAYLHSPERFAGIGFVLGNGWVGVDADDVRDPALGGIAAPWAAELLTTARVYADVSPSGTGLKIIGRGTWPGEWNKRPHPSGIGEVEVYPEGRYFTVTGVPAGNSTAIGGIQPVLDELAPLFEKKTTKTPVLPGLRPVATPFHGDDDPLIAKMERSKNGEEICRLMRGDTSGFKSHSEAVGSLLCHLAFWTGKDAARMDSIFRRSGLMSAKWDSRRGDSTWGQRDIASAIEKCDTVYEPRNEPKAAFGESASAVSGMSGVQPRPSAPRYIEFPVDAMPERVQSFIHTVATATSTDPAFTALPLLSALGAVVGTARVVMPKNGWRIFPTFWTMCVGRSASGKSPPLSAVNEALNPLIDELEEENRAAMDEYHELKARHLTDKSKKGMPPPPEPPAKRIRVGDTTIEAVSVTLSHNPRGLLSVHDELHGWFSSFTRYSGGKGNTDRPKWLSLFDSGCLEVDRKTGDPKHIAIRNTLVAVAGGIQPGVLRPAMSEENISSGLFARILLAYPPDRLTEWSEVEIPESLTAELTALFRALRWFEPTEFNGRPVPVRNTLCPKAKSTFISFFNSNRHRAFTADDAEAAVTTKLESYALRIAHLRHLCRFAGRDDSQPISATDMAAGIKLAEWFLNEFHRVRALLAEPERMQGQRRLVSWIRGKGGSVTARQLQKSDARRYPDSTSARVRLEQLASDGLGEWHEERATNNKTVTRFVLHPEPQSDARHCQTLPDDGDDDPSDTVSDTENSGHSENLENQGKPETVSDTVWRLTLSQTLTGETTPTESASGAVSDTPFEPLPEMFYRSAEPKVVFGSGRKNTCEDVEPFPFGANAPAPTWQSELLALIYEYGPEWTSTPVLVDRLNDRLPGPMPHAVEVREFLARKAEGGEIERNGENLYTQTWRIAQ